MRKRLKLIQKDCETLSVLIYAYFLSAESNKSPKDISAGINALMQTLKEEIEEIGKIKPPEKV